MFKKITKLYNRNQHSVVGQKRIKDFKIKKKQKQKQKQTNMHTNKPQKKRPDLWLLEARGRGERIG